MVDNEHEDPAKTEEVKVGFNGEMGEDKDADKGGDQLQSDDIEAKKAEPDNIDQSVLDDVQRQLMIDSEPMKLTDLWCERPFTMIAV